MVRSIVRETIDSFVFTSDELPEQFDHGGEIFYSSLYIRPWIPLVCSQAQSDIAGLVKRSITQKMNFRPPATWILLFSWSILRFEHTVYQWSLS